MENTRPFRRVLGRRVHLVAHNATVDGFEQAVDNSALHYRPVGETDSEYVFCTLLSRLHRLYQESDTPPLNSRFDIFFRCLQGYEEARNQQCSLLRWRRAVRARS